MTSFLPIDSATVNLNTSLIGVSDPTKFTDPDRIESLDLYARHPHGKLTPEHTIRYTIIVVFISAVIFVTVISIYDVIKNGINYIFAKRALSDPESHNSSDSIHRTLVANKNTLVSSSVFCGVCIVISVVSIPLLVIALKAHHPYKYNL